MVGGLINVQIGEVLLIQVLLYGCRYACTYKPICLVLISDESCLPGWWSNSLSELAPSCCLPCLYDMYVCTYVRMYSPMYILYFVPYQNALYCTYICTYVQSYVHTIFCPLPKRFILYIQYAELMLIFLSSFRDIHKD